MSDMQRKKQYDLETAVRWIIGSIFWLVSVGFSIMLANQFWNTIKIISQEVIARKDIESIVTISGQINFVDRMSLFILGFVVAALIAYLFFKYVDPVRADDEIFLIEGHEYFTKPWFERIELMRILKFFIVSTLIGFGIYLITWISVLLVAALT